MLHYRNISNVSESLRLLPLGDSITDGWYSSDDNGYRLDLQKMLVAGGYSVNFIGSLSKGKNNSDNHYEGFAGKTINQIHQYVRNDNILAEQPNIVLLHAGTNDMKLDPPLDPYSTAPDRLGALMDEVLCRVPSTVLLVAQIVQDDDAQDRTNSFNKAIPNLVDARSLQGYQVQLVNLSSIGGSDLQDGVHPDDAGYLLMAQAWYQAIQSLPTNWTISTEIVYNNSTTRDIATCKNAATNGTASPVSAAPSSTTSLTSPSATKGDAGRSSISFASSAFVLLLLTHVLLT